MWGFPMQYGYPYSMNPMMPPITLSMGMESRGYGGSRRGSYGGREGYDGGRGGNRGGGRGGNRGGGRGGNRGGGRGGNRGGGRGGNHGGGRDTYNVTHSSIKNQPWYDVELGVLIAQKGLLEGDILKNYSKELKTYINYKKKIHYAEINKEHQTVISALIMVQQVAYKKMKQLIENESKESTVMHVDESKT